MSTAVVTAAEPAAWASVQPDFKEFCLTCHSAEKHKGDLDLEQFRTLEDIRKQPKVWQAVVEQMELGEMPPKDKPQPTSARREAIRKQLLAQRVGCEFHYPVPDHFQPGLAIQERPRLAVTEAWCAETFTLPCFPEMTDAEVCQVAGALRGAVGAPAGHAAA